MQSEQSQNCQNCHRPFPISKIDLHESYCRRNVRRCGQCSKMYDINQEQAHKQEHIQKLALAVCPHCKKECSPPQLNNHVSTCPKKPVQCHFCQNIHSFGEIAQHEQVCGSRTRTCETCGKYVKLKDYHEHSQRCILRPQNALRRNESQEVIHHQLNRVAPNVSERERIVSNDQKKNEILFSPQKENLKHNKRPIKQFIPPEHIYNRVDPIPICIKKTLQKQKQNPPKH